MNKDLENRAEDLAFIPETFRHWIERSQAPTEEGQTWREYTLLMVTFAEAFARAPLTAEVCDKIDIHDHLTQETDLLIATLRLIAKGE